MEFHPLANLFPLMEGREFDELVADIEAHGCREPIYILDDQILDGRNRWRACERLGARPTLVEYEGDDPAAFVVSLNLHRRHLDESQRAIVGKKLANLAHGGDRRSDQAASLPVVTQAKAAEMLNVSERSIRSAGAVLDHGAPELVHAVEQGRVSVSAAADVASLPKREQAEIVARGEAEILQSAKDIRGRKSEARREEHAKLRAAAPLPPAGKYRCIVIDPPWPVQKYERDVRPNQTAELDYPTMDHEQIAAFDVGAMAADDGCHLFCWTTHKHLPATLGIIEGWGFTYCLTMVWHKPGGPQPFGLPQYNCEFVIYARRNAPEFTDTKAFSTCFAAPRREHSRKPDEFYAVIERVTAGPRIDVFSREPREGFAQFGNEIGKFAA